MKILLIADVHNRPSTKKTDHDLTLFRLRRAIKKTPHDLIVFLGDIVHAPDFQIHPVSDYKKYLCEVLDLAGDSPFATVFGNHDDECDITKNEIIEIISTYENAQTKGRNYTLELEGETLLFIDSGSYYPTDESLYDVVSQDVIDWAKSEIQNKKAILFQHIITPNIKDYVKNSKIPRFKKGVKHSGFIFEAPCPPDINNFEFETLSPNLKGAVFGHDHKNSFEFMINDTKIIQVGGCSRNCYDKNFVSTIKLLDTKTMKTKTIYI